MALVNRTMTWILWILNGQSNAGFFMKICLSNLCLSKRHRRPQLSNVTKTSHVAHPIKTFFKSVSHILWQSNIMAKRSSQQYEGKAKLLSLQAYNTWVPSRVTFM